MIAQFAAVLLCARAAAAPVAPPAPAQAPAAPAVRASTAAASAAPASAALGVSTDTVSTLYTGDRVRDPFMPPSVGGGPARPRDKNAPLVVDIHALELRGIMRDGKTDFAIFSTDTGARLILRGSRLYDDRNKPVHGITGSINIKQKRAVLITSDRDRQPFNLGEPDANKAKAGPGTE
jgi:hypothetical protein